MTTNYWHNKICLVTGGSAGLGLALAGAWARQGARVVLAARRQEPLEQAAAELRRLGSEVLTVVADVTCQKDVDRLLATVADRYGQLDLLCNCAGQSARRAILDTTTDDFQQLLEVNLLATVRTTRAAAEMLIASCGHVVNIGSLASKVAPRFLGAYPASKFAVAAYSQQLRLELAPHGLHVLLVCPGPIARDEQTPRYASQSQNLPAEAQRPGGGAKLKQIDPRELAEKILNACQGRRAELIVPGKARLLFVLSQLSPRLGDWLLRRSTS